MTVAGVAGVVLASVLMLALSRGLFARLDTTGEAENLLAISRKGQSTIFSSIEDDELVHLGNLPGIARGPDGDPLVSPELLHVPFVSRPGAEGHRPVSLRGVKPVAYAVHRSVRVTAGRLPEADFELLAGRTAHVKLGAPAGVLEPGKTLRFEGREWTVVGRFEAGGGLLESELWAREEDVQTVLRRRTHSLVVARFGDAGQVAAALPQFGTSGAAERFFKAWGEREHYAEATRTFAWVFWLSVFMVAAIASAGALLAVNTMVTSVLHRRREIATQRVLGFGGADIAASLLVESLAMALAGGAIGAGLGLLLDDIPLRFSQGAFFLQVDGVVVAAALGLSALVGVTGALHPAVRILRMPVIGALSHE
jgi:putative ABC transport system permease protein